VRGLRGGRRSPVCAPQLLNTARARSAPGAACRADQPVCSLSGSGRCTPALLTQRARRLVCSSCAADARARFSLDAGGLPNGGAAPLHPSTDARTSMFSMLTSSSGLSVRGLVLTCGDGGGGAAMRKKGGPKRGQQQAGGRAAHGGEPLATGGQPSPPGRMHPRAGGWCPAWRQRGSRRGSFPAPSLWPQPHPCPSPPAQTRCACRPALRGKRAGRRRGWVGRHVEGGSSQGKQAGQQAGKAVHGTGQQMEALRSDSQAHGGNRKGAASWRAASRPLPLHHHHHHQYNHSAYVNNLNPPPPPSWLPPGPSSRSGQQASGPTHRAWARS
jgi:hypothetical protein